MAYAQTFKYPFFEFNRLKREKRTKRKKKTNRKIISIRCYSIHIQHKAHINWYFSFFFFFCLLIVFITSCQSRFSCLLRFNNNIYRFSIWWCSEWNFQFDLLKVCFIFCSLFDVFIHFDGLVIFCLQSMIFAFVSSSELNRNRWGVCEHAKSIVFEHDSSNEWTKNWIRKWKIDSFICIYSFIHFVNRFVSQNCRCECLWCV